MSAVGKCLVKGLMALNAALPLKVHYGLSGFVAWLAGSVIRYRYNEVTVNLSRCFPEKNYWEIDEIRRQFYRHFADIIVEAVWFGGCRKAERLKKAKIVSVKNPEVINGLYEKAPSVMVLYTHCGNWELLGGIASYIEGPTPINEGNYCVLYRALHSKMWDEIMRENRFAPIEDRKNYQGYLESKAFVRYAFSHRNEKKIYNSNTDQRPYFEGSDSIGVTFMGKEVTTMSASAAIARKFGMAVCYMKMKVVERGHYEIEYIPICEDASQTDVKSIMDRYYELLDAELREQPFNYLWTHRRWI